jgi:hypothetical protein
MQFQHKIRIKQVKTDVQIKLYKTFIFYSSENKVRGHYKGIILFLFFSDQLSDLCCLIVCY